jgi:hypothetical protein
MAKDKKVNPLSVEINDLFTHSQILAAEKLTHAFIHPPRLRPTPEQKALLNTSQPFTLTISDTPIQVYTWTPLTHSKNPKPPTILLTHGYGTAACSMLSFLPPLLASNFRIVAWDQTAHGASGGDWGNLDLFKEAFVVLARKYSPIEAVIGHSAGATMVLVALRENRDLRRNVKKVVCLSAPTHFENVIARYCVGMGVRKEVGELAQKWMEERKVALPVVVGRAVGEKEEDIGRVLVVQDRDDQVATVNDAEWLRYNFARVRIEFTEGNGHYKGLRDPRVVELVSDFVLESVDAISKL